VVTRLESLLLITVEMTLLVNTFQHRPTILELVQDGISAGEDVIDQALELLDVDLVDLDSALLQLLHQVPMQEGEALVDHKTVELQVPIIIPGHVVVVDCEQFRVELLLLSALHDLRGLVPLVLPLQALQYVAELNDGLIIVVVALRAPVRHVERYRMEVNLPELLKTEDALETFTIDDPDALVIIPPEPVDNVERGLCAGGVHDPLGDAVGLLLAQSVANNEHSILLVNVQVVLEVR
jgi:hypothetical protein